MKKYYIGFIVLMAVCLGALAYTLTQAGDAKADKATDQVVEQVAAKMDTYTSNNAAVPKKLSDIGIKNAPSTVSYQAISDTKYKICFNYHAATSGFDAGWGSLLLGGITGGSGSNYQPQANYGNSGYFDSSVETSHKKGPNCQTVETYSAGLYPGGNASTNIYGNSLLQNQTSTNQSSSCSDPPSSNYKVAGSITVSSVDTSKSLIYFSPQNQYVYDNVSGQNVPTIASKSYNSNTLFCSVSNLSTSSVSALKPGDVVTIYLTSASEGSLGQVDIDSN